MNSDNSKEIPLVKFGNVCKFQGGNGFKEEIQGLKSGDFPFIKVSDMEILSNKKYILDANNWIDQKTSIKESIKLFPKNSVVFAKVGAALLLNRRRILTRDTAIDNNMMAAIPENIEFEFLFYLLSNIDFSNFVQSGAVPSVNQTQLSSIEILLPCSNEQEKIAEVLSTIDRAIAQTEAIIAKQQRIKTGLMQDLLTKGIDENGNIRSEATHEFKDSAIGRIPIEWGVETIGKIASLQRGHDIREVEFISGNYPVIASSGVIGFHNIRTSDSPNVVVGRKGSIGNIYYLDIDFWAHDTSLYVTNFFGNNEKYIYYLFSYLELERFGTKSGSPSLNRNDIHPLKISLPNPPEQKRISKILSYFDTSIANLKSGLNKLQHQKTGLMQDLLTGKVRVTNLLK